MDEDSRVTEGFDEAAAITRSLLGYGVVAGIFYLTVGVILGSTREGRWLPAGCVAAPPSAAASSFWRGPFRVRIFIDG